MKWPNQNFQIIQYTRMTQPFEIQCLNCGKISKYTTCANFFNSGRKGICQCYNEKNKNNLHNINQQKAISICKEKGIEKYDFYYDNSNSKYRIRVICPQCHQEYSKPLSFFCTNPSCYFCENRHELNTQGFASTLPEEYVLLSDYIDENTKVLVRHNCGFIWKVIPKKLYGAIGCPKCNKRRSKGEQKLTSLLEQKSVPFEIEKSFDWSSNSRRRYDFFLPTYNLLIEYQGRQHFEETNFFKTSLAEQQIIDKEKREEALANGYNYLEISYQDFDNIEQILENWFNDYSNGKYTQVSRNKKHESEDIV